MRIAVSAASGRLGHAILRKLIEESGTDALIAIARNPARISIPEMNCRQADYQSIEQMSAALEGVDTLIMISAPVASGGDRLALHRNVIAAAKTARVRRVIYTSVIGNGAEAGTLFEDFANINRSTETDLQQSGLEWVIARNGLYLDLDVLQIRGAAKHDGAYRNNAGNARCGYISIAELATAYAALALSPNTHGQSFNLIGTTYTQNDLVEATNRAFGLRVSYVTVSFADNLERLRSVPFIAARGEAVINMLAGCFQCIEKGVFDVPSDYRQVTGREAFSLAEQMTQLHPPE
jgi:NAD(P)H dehydrogenase (quinone)